MNFTYSSQRKNFGGAPLQRDIHYSEAMIGHIRILGIGLELACNGGSCGEYH